MLTNDVISFEQPGPDKETLTINYILDEKLAHTPVSQKTILCYSTKRKNKSKVRFIQGNGMI